jgi:hypothetical protein
MKKEMTNGRKRQSRQGEQGTEEESQAHPEGEEEIETGKEEEPLRPGSLRFGGCFFVEATIPLTSERMFYYNPHRVHPPHHPLGVFTSGGTLIA